MFIPVHLCPVFSLLLVGESGLFDFHRLNNIGNISLYCFMGVVINHYRKERLYHIDSGVVILILCVFEPLFYAHAREREY